VRVLLDESVPRPLAPLLVSHEVRTVTQLRWTGIKNGELLSRAAAESFDVVLTADQNIEFQQNLSKLPVAVIVLIAKTNRIESLEPLVPEILAVLEALQPKTLRRIGA
jgi:hypothetical protein